ncbi:MAG: energy transducer TonB [Gammaproteobacteria bacterium]
MARAAREPLPAAADAEHAQPDDALRRWELAVLAQLDRHKRYPAAAQLNRQQDRVAVRIRVDRSGAVLSRRIVRSRGYPSLDGEALALIARADPLPAPPDGVDEHALDFSVHIDFEIATPRALN